jgi:peptidoglycan/LPS O-acetylase OafA/YrhL
MYQLSLERGTRSSAGIGHEPITSHELPQLYGLRALAVLAVVIAHSTTVTHRLGLSLGSFGVYLFFVLSGYLITGILVRSREKAERLGVGLDRVWFAFLARRALRIFPLYYAALLVAITLGLGDARHEWPWYAAFLPNVRIAYQGEWPDALGHFWSLAVEEQFYLLWPVACFFIPRRHLLRLAIVCVVSAPMLRFLLLCTSVSDISSVTWMPCCLDGLGLGAVLALTGRAPRVWAAACGLAFIAVVAVARQYAMAWSLQLPVVLFGSALLSWWLVGHAATGFRGRVGRALESQTLTYLGRISFGIYVVHYLVPPAILVIQTRLGISLGLPSTPGSARLFYVAIVSVAVASLSWYAMERPINSLKRFFPYVPATPIR